MKIQKNRNGGAWTKLVAMLSVLCIILVGCGLFVKTPEPTPSPTSFKVDFNDESKYSKSNWVISPVIVPNSIEPNAIVDKDKKFIAINNAVKDAKPIVVLRQSPELGESFYVKANVVLRRDNNDIKNKEFGKFGLIINFFDQLNRIDHPMGCNSNQKPVQSYSLSLYANKPSGVEFDKENKKLISIYNKYELEAV
ncbi:MAG: hypothetical protein WCP16_25240 [Pseudanabaena sp. ELA645]|jgi:hypothetical protein